MIDIIVGHINEQILKQTVFKNTVKHPVCTSQLREVGNNAYDQVPTYWKSGKPVDVVPSDSHTLQLWHRVNGITYLKPLIPGYGDKVARVRSIQCSAIVLMNTSKLKMNADVVELMIADQLPSGITKDLMTKLKLISCTIEHTGVDFNSAAIYRREFQTQKYQLKPQHSMFEVKYKIECTFHQGCINTCDECQTNNT